MGEQGQGRVIRTIDLHFQGVAQAIAAYLIEGEQPILIETGPHSTLPALLAGLAEWGYTPADIRHVLVTHIHFDHAGAAGWWAQQGAHVYVHHVGARHLIDPSRLVRSATRIYGDQMGVLWGEITAAPAERVTSLHDGDRISVGGMTVVALDTPGHATHHMSYVLDGVAFTGDCTGVRIPGTTFVGVTAPPPEFDREAWHATLGRLAAQNLQAIYPTHFGRVDDVAGHFARLATEVDAAAEVIYRGYTAGLDRDALVGLYVPWVHGRMRAAGLDDEAIAKHAAANPLPMSVDGLLRYWQKRGQG